jgi:hypothetical protein
MTNGHIIYIGKHKDLYLDMFKDEIKSFVDVQGVDLKIWEESDIRDLLSTKFDESVLKAFDSIQPYALKTDLARFCILYEFGGIYSDLGLTFLNKLKTDGYDLVLFRDIPVESIYEIDCAIQISLMFSKPKNDLMYKTIMALSDIYNTKQYGDNPMYPGGEVQLGKIILEDNQYSIFLGNFGENFTNLEDVLGDRITLSYWQDGIIVLFKSFRKNEILKNLDIHKTNYIHSWFHKTLYEGNTDEANN